MLPFLLLLVSNIYLTVDPFPFLLGIVGHSREDCSLKVSDAVGTNCGCCFAVPPPPGHLGSFTSDVVFGKETRLPLQILQDKDVQKVRFSLLPSVLIIIIITLR